MKKDKVEQAASNPNIYTATAETYLQMSQEDETFNQLSLESQQAAVAVEIKKQQGTLEEWKEEVIDQGVKDMVGEKGDVSQYIPGQVTKQQPNQIEEGEWICAGRCIQKNDHPKLAPFCSFTNSTNNPDRQGHFSFQEAIDYCNKNPCTDGFKPECFGVK
jgi:hypothetical protein